MLSDALETGIIAGLSLSHTGKLGACDGGNPPSRDLFQLFGRELMELLVNGLTSSFSAFSSSFVFIGIPPRFLMDFIKRRPRQMVTCMQ